MITITETAIQELKRIKTEQQLPNDVFVRVSIRGGGCSGYMYGLEFEEADKFNTAMDKVQIEADGVKVVVDKKSDLFLDGTILGYETDSLARRGFKFDNPNAMKTCGCGQSFCS